MACLRIPTLEYALEKLDVAASSLAAGKGRVLERLENVWGSALSRLEPGDFPEALRQDFELVAKSLGSDLAMLTEGQGAEIAEKIRLFTRIAESAWRAGGS